MVVHTNIKMFEIGEYAVIFNGKDMTLKFLPMQLYRNCDVEDVPYEYPITGTSLLFGHIQSNFSDVSPSHTSQIDSSEQRQKQHPVLHRLTLNVSNTCNMGCKYCYANRGDYYTQGMLMDKDTALNAINFAVRNFSHIDSCKLLRWRANPESTDYGVGL